MAVRFHSFVPPPTLPAVAQLSWQEADQPFRQSVLPELGLMLGFQFRGRLSVELPGGERGLNVHGVTGIHDEPRVFRGSGPLGSVLVRLQPWAGGFLGIPAAELTGQSVGLEAFFSRGELDDVTGTLAEIPADQRLNHVATFLERCLAKGDSDPLTVRAVYQIERRRGLVRVADLAEQLGTSHSPLLRRFHDQVGVGPKAYASLVRLRRLLPLLQTLQGNLTDLAAAMGFHDQAHFIGEFRRMTGLTPRQYQRRDRWTESLLHVD